MDHAGLSVERFETMDVQGLAAQPKRTDQQPFVLDVATDPEWSGGHIDGAHHVQVGLVPEHLEELPRDRTIAVVCGTGYRSTIVSSLLAQRISQAHQYPGRHDRMEGCGPAHGEVDQSHPLSPVRRKGSRARERRGRGEGQGAHEDLLAHFVKPIAKRQAAIHAS